MSTENQEAQEDELLALSSIYSEDEFKRADTAPGGEIQVCLELPPNFKISVKSNSAANSIVESFEGTVLFLPPIVLNFELPPGYPSTTCPIFTLSCKWLSSKQLTLLCQHLDDLWEENGGCVVLFAWMQFLKEETLEYLNIKSPYEIQLHNNGTHTLMKTHEKASHCVATPEEGAVDRRAIQDVQSVSALTKHILNFNENQQKKCFDSKPFLCNICFSEKLGSECTYFKDCSHVYCNSCLRDYFEIQIRDGEVHALNCPEPKCTSVATPAQVKMLVGEQLFSRYDRLLLQSTLDLMSDVVYCPRPSCETPVMQEPGDPMGICSSCQYAFCTLCRMTYHGVSPCKLTAEKLLALRDEYLAADEDGKKFLEKRYGKRVLQKAVEELESVEWLEQNSKPCPRCGTYIQKIDGCNKMTCTGCKQYFCWLCKNMLSRGSPYDHFNDPSSGCFNLLFRGVNMDQDFFDEEED
ncbi:E3 ubiquitin-protein ligase RNF14 isoform X1 [Rana temporaria]|uniref:E3 ubiquitin-protein ligase RNF14 isoform X1 n=1 Tax=Rana temporaria TaxID=8407 RepID=UPI001AAD5F04|nr:E3 ubiquitin-protein ligase RNF14 isoform X1 [Rana temporaria]XP_040200548.1 E3 ubiquitin-protein ligase RNF14 isoform X1 [Rana temporaria]XP_040200549.1 E3 ubiquitin-protein ligase RNF14 isoform X1 [Rana temporaria]XP_040200550.1 E3 ubiquitin-protein ligase RNF14 isoform X1 [Rana temporaria]